MRTLRRAASQRIGGFDPIAGIAWQNAYWAGGSELAALGLADTDPVSTWPDEKGTANATSTLTKRPLFRTTAGANSKPCVRFDGSNDIMQAVVSSVNQPYSFVVIAAQTSATNTKGTLLRGGAVVLLDTEGTGKQLRYYAGSVVSGGTQDQAWHLHVTYLNGASSKYDIDGSNVLSGNPGANASQTGLNIGNEAGETRPMEGDIAFLGLCSGDVRSDGGWASFKTWVGSQYGLTIA